MKTLWEFLAQFWRQLRPWVVVLPWQQAIRVRLGKWQRLLGPGIHVKIPLCDAVFVQSVRRRVCKLTTQTITTSDGKALTLGACLAYRIADVELVYRTLHHPEDSLENIAQAAVAAAVAKADAAHCQPAAIAEVAARGMQLAPFGIADAELSITDFAFVRTYRLINDPRYRGHGDVLESTSEQI